MRKFIIILAILFFPNQSWPINLGTGSSYEIFTAIKKVALQEINNKFTIYNWGAYSNKKGQKFIDLDGAGGSALFLSDGFVEWDDPLHQVVHYAVWLLLFKRDLKKLGLISESQKYLDDIERIAISEIEAIRKLPQDVSSEYLIEHFRKEIFGNQYRKAKEKLAMVLNKTLSVKKQSSLLKFTVGQFPRGGGEISVRIETFPKDAQVSLITLFHFNVCLARKNDPWNTDTCYGWRDIVTAEISLSGDYRYVARWKDGAFSKGSFTISRKSINSEEPIQIQLKR